ncbi:MAG: lysophospholipid acyltransferase family protein [Candidatus Protochlamydia sp.]|nr:lysophospholipid acyltransferase family protein [Candidatus Protochlamydia sp.]
MLAKLKQTWKNGIYNLSAFLIATVGKQAMKALLLTCRWKIEGLDHFRLIASKEKCLLMLWHNQLALAPFILHRYVGHLVFTAFVSNSRDGHLISRIVSSYKNGRTIRVPHHSRHQALREMIRQVEEKKSIVVITPDGPRGPRYKMKPGIALAAMQTQAYVFPLKWSASNFWELRTWDKLRLPKPFSIITVSFHAPLRMDEGKTLPEAKQILEQALL